MKKAEKVKVYKFGGASIRNAGAVRNMAEIIGQESSPLVIVVSAMGKTTNALEEILEKARNGQSCAEFWERVKRKRDASGLVVMPRLPTNLEIN